MLAQDLGSLDKGRAAVRAEIQSEQWLAWEKDCVERARRGDRAAFAELYRAFARPLYSQCLLPRLGSRAAAEDVLAETFRVLLESLDGFVHEGKSIWFWIVRVAINKANDAHRAAARKGRALASYEKLVEPIAPASLTPDSELELAERAARLSALVADVLGRINPRYRRAIELRVLEERSREDCAAALEVKLGTFDVLVLRALRAFRSEWEAVLGNLGEAESER